MLHTFYFEHGGRVMIAVTAKDKRDAWKRITRRLDGSMRPVQLVGESRQGAVIWGRKS